MKYFNLNLYKEKGTQSMVHSNQYDIVSNSAISLINSGI